MTAAPTAAQTAALAPAPEQRRRRPWTLRRQLVALLIGLVLVICTVLAVVSTLALRSQLLDQVDAQLKSASDRAVIRPRMMDRPSDTGQPGDQILGPDQLPGQIPGQSAGTIDVFFSGTEVIQASYPNNAGTSTPLTDAQLAELMAIPTDGRIHPVHLSDLGSYRAISATNVTGNRVITALPTTTADEPLRSYLVVEIMLIVLAAGVAAAAATILVRRALRPLERVAETAMRVSELPLDRGEVVQIQGVEPGDTDERTEVGTVGAALNRLLGHVESSLAARHESETQVRQFVADASHELRTPLASIRGYAELVRRSPDVVPADTLRSLDRIESEALRMGALVEDLLLLARLDAGRPLERADVDLTVLAIDAAADAHAASRDHVWRLELPDDEDGAAPVESTDAVVTGDEARLRQVFTNLLGNARVHTPPGTTVVLSVRPERDQVVIAVTDDGPGIPPSLASSLFQRFSRGDSARNRGGGSTGLGLAIAQAIVAAHRGEITVRAARPPATGATFEVRLPRTPAPGQATPTPR
ncbi:two-component system, OmpR family, sensor kinase [Sanguibacter gelidistatuariae]|uniref:histidine kinase n=1 Tax=Sanguibacter gelidistatuariae TaxID=1814289 RepID=A0A1G6HNG6_9MICO|nr:HAMP domain-containing sensor histidine kinase [Sanguibacter gelidistatuariae]SDB95678.1 two-component system, OmpR family, sensor kinase [Sanguibacter gelidistatuariae]